MNRYAPFLLLLALISAQETLVNETTLQETIPKFENKTIDVFEKEIEAVENLIQLYKKKIEILQSLREHYLVNQKPIMVIFFFIFIFIKNPKMK